MNKELMALIRRLRVQVDILRSPELPIGGCAKAISDIADALAAAGYAELREDAERYSLNKEYARETINEAIRRYPGSENAITFLASAMGPTGTITATDIEAVLALFGIDAARKGE